MNNVDYTNVLFPVFCASVCGNPGFFGNQSRCKASSHAHSTLFHSLCSSNNSTLAAVILSIPCFSLSTSFFHTFRLWYMLNLLSQLALTLPRSWHGNNTQRKAALTTILPATTIAAATTSTTPTSVQLVEALVNRLPYDILLLIFSQLELGDRIRCMRVCYTWRALLMEWPGMWDTLSTKDGCNIGYDLAPYIQYIRGKAVKRITYDEADIRSVHDGEVMVEKMMDLLVKRNCSNISQGMYIIRKR